MTFCRSQITAVCVCVGVTFCQSWCSPALADGLGELIQSSCIACHNENTETRLDFTKLYRDFEDSSTFRAWVNVVDRIDNGEMPPASEPRPDAQTQTAALTFLKKKLFEVNRRQQQ